MHAGAESFTEPMPNLPADITEMIMMRESSCRLAEYSDINPQTDDIQVTEYNTTDNSLLPANSKENSAQPHQRLVPNSSQTRHPLIAELHKLSTFSTTRTTLLKHAGWVSGGQIQWQRMKITIRDVLANLSQPSLESSASL